MECILVGVDGSWGSREAIRSAADLAKSTGSRLILATAVYFHKALGAPELQAQVAAWEEEENERSAKVLGKMAGVLRRRGAAVETLVLSGSPAEALCEEARSAEVDLVVVGHRGRGGLRRVLPGSVAVRLVEVCPKPVMVVGQRPANGWRKKRWNWRQGKKERAPALQLVRSLAPARR